MMKVFASERLAKWDGSAYVRGGNALWRKLGDTVNPKSAEVIKSLMMDAMEKGAERGAEMIAEKGVDPTEWVLWSSERFSSWRTANNLRNAHLHMLSISADDPDFGDPAASYNSLGAIPSNDEKVWSLTLTRELTFVETCANKLVDHGWRVPFADFAQLKRDDEQTRFIRERFGGI